VWNADYTSKLLSGEILINLRIRELLGAGGVEEIIFDVPDYGEQFIADFYEGAMVQLYERRSAADTVCNRQLVRGYIVRLTDTELHLHLSYKQRNRDFFSLDTTYAIEKDSTDSSFQSARRGLFALLTAPQERRELLLCQRAPRFDTSVKLCGDYGARTNAIVLPAMQAQDYYLLVGPPGTGKTEFVKHLGRAVGGKVVVKMGSDLLSRWVGGTESNIRQAFAEAEADNAVLFLDEIDGLVQDRSGAQHGWEVSQVNELLHRMENFKGVMVGATNFMDNLDAAIMRRFTFKFQFDYLDEKGKRLFFERMFKTRLSGAEAERLAGIPCLAPGDFRTVRQSFYYLGCDVTNAMRLDGLEKESALKKKSPRRIGF
jgi:hypothetical protein